MKNSRAGSSVSNIFESPFSLKEFIERTRHSVSGKSKPSRVGDIKLSKEPAPLVQEAIDRAYDYWTGASVVGAREVKKKTLSKTEKMARVKYLSTLSQIKDYKRKTPTTISALGILRHWQQDPALIQIVQDTLGETPGYYNIIKLAEEATPEEFEHWINWYHHAHEDVKSLQKKHNRIRKNEGLPPYPFNVVAAVVAVLSPNNSWLNNLAAADYILTNQSGEGSTAYRANANKALRMMDTWLVDEVRGPKVTVFYESLHRPWKMGDHVVLDGHMINIWRGNKAGIHNVKQPGKEERAQMLHDFRQAAADLGITPQSIQALTWYIWRYTTDKPKPYPKAIMTARTEFIADLKAQQQARKLADQIAEEYLREEEMFWGKSEDQIEGMATGISGINSKPTLKKNTATNLPALLNTDKKAKKILDGLPGGARTWLLGGCWVLARALQIHLGGELVAVQAPRGPIEHIALKLSKQPVTYYIDGSGVHESRECFADSMKKELGFKPWIVILTKQDLKDMRDKGNISFSEKSATELSKILKSHKFHVFEPESETKNKPRSKKHAVKGVGTRKAKMSSQRPRGKSASKAIKGGSLLPSGKRL